MWLLGKKKSIRCPDGRVVFVYKNVEDVYPFLKQKVARHAGLDVAAKNALSAKVGGDYAGAIEGALYSISKRQSSLLIQLRAAYISYEVDPCTNAAAFNKTVEEVLSFHRAGDEIESRIEAVLTLAKLTNVNRDAIVAKFSKLTGAIGAFAPESAAVLEMRRAEHNATEWADGEDNV